MFRNVPGYEVDSLISKDSSDRNGATSLMALSSNSRSGSRASLSGVGTQIVTTEAADTSAGLFVAKYFLAAIAFASLTLDISSTGLDS